MAASPAINIIVFILACDWCLWTIDCRVIGVGRRVAMSCDRKQWWYRANLRGQFRSAILQIGLFGKMARGGCRSEVNQMHKNFRNGPLIKMARRWCPRAISAATKCTLIISRLTCCLYIHFYTLTSKFITCRMLLVFKLMINILNICWSRSNGQKSRYAINPFLITISLNFLILRSKYMLHNVIQSWGISRYLSWHTTQLNSLYSWMNLQQTNIHPIENMARCRLESHFMNTDNLNAAKGSLFFLHIPMIVLSHRRLNIDHSRKSCLKISLKNSFYQCATPFPAYIQW